MWLRNCWYVIACDHQIPLAGSPELFSRTVPGEPVLVYRTADSAIVAMEDPVLLPDGYSSCAILRRRCYR